VLPSAGSSRYSRLTMSSVTGASGISPHGQNSRCSSSIHRHPVSWVDHAEAAQDPAFRVDRQRAIRAFDVAVGDGLDYTGRPQPHSRPKPSTLAAELQEASPLIWAGLSDLSVVVDG
jgi:hypothetical protein